MKNFHKSVTNLLFLFRMAKLPVNRTVTPKNTNVIVETSVETVEVVVLGVGAEVAVLGVVVMEIGEVSEVVEAVVVEEVLEVVTVVAVASEVVVTVVAAVGSIAESRGEAMTEVAEEEAVTEVEEEEAVALGNLGVTKEAVILTTEKALVVILSHRTIK